MEFASSSHLQMCCKYEIYKALHSLVWNDHFLLKSREMDRGQGPGRILGLDVGRRRQRDKGAYEAGEE